MPKGIPNSGINKGWFVVGPRPNKRTGVFKECPCGDQFYCEKGKIERKKYCSVKCRQKFGLKAWGIRSDQARRNISLGKKGKKFSESHRKNIGLSSMGRLQSLETKIKNRNAQIDRWNKIGRKIYKRYKHFCSSTEYKTWRRLVFARDSYKCRMCGVGGYLEAHHILGWTDYPDLRYEINNGITLCRAHHPRKRAEEKRLSPYFQGLVSVSKDSNY